MLQRQSLSEKRFSPIQWHLDTGYFGILNQSAETSPLIAFATDRVGGNS